MFPLAGILRCPQCGAAMVIGRTSKLRKDGTHPHVKEQITMFVGEGDKTENCDIIKNRFNRYFSNYMIK